MGAEWVGAGSSVRVEDRGGSEFGGERVAAAVVPAEPARSPDPKALRAAARSQLTGAQTPKEIVLVDTLLDALPLRGVGEPDRGAVRALLADAL
ncbi:MAG: hypothetical protein ACRDSP_07720 [Pseudonocardiaceae bacterium]